MSISKGITCMQQKELESIFIETIIPNKQGYFYGRRFHFKSQKYNQNKGTTEFLEHPFSDNFFPQITL